MPVNSVVCDLDSNGFNNGSIGLFGSVSSTK